MFRICRARNYCAEGYEVSAYIKSSPYEGHPINRENFLIIQEFVPLEHGKCIHKIA